MNVVSDISLEALCGKLLSVSEQSENSKNKYLSLALIRSSRDHIKYVKNLLVLVF